MIVTLIINGTEQTVDVDEATPLLWVLRDELGLKATKFGCGRSACGACTVHLDGEAIRSCSVPVSAAADAEVVTLEGLGTPEAPHPVQQAWTEEVVPQCGYCQPGFMMAAAALLAQAPDPSDEDIDRTITNVCRCATHVRIRKAIHRAAEIGASSGEAAGEGGDR